MKAMGEQCNKGVEWNGYENGCRMVEGEEGEN